MKSSVIPSVLGCMAGYEAINTYQVASHFAGKNHVVYDPKAAGFYLGAKTVMKATLNYGMAYLGAAVSKVVYQTASNDFRDTEESRVMEWFGLVMMGMFSIPLSILLAEKGAHYFTKQVYGAQALTEEKIRAIANDYSLWQQDHDNPL